MIKTIFSPRLIFPSGEQDPCGESSGEEAEEMPLPRNAGLPGQHATKKSTVDHKHDKGNQDPESRPLDDAPSKKESEVAEDEEAGTYVVRAAGSEHPYRCASKCDDQDRGEGENPATAEEDGAAKGEKRQGVRGEMAEARVKKWRHHDSPNSCRAARPDPELIKRAEENEIKNLEGPACGGEAKE